MPPIPTAGRLRLAAPVNTSHRPGLNCLSAELWQRNKTKAGSEKKKLLDFPPGPGEASTRQTRWNVMEPGALTKPWNDNGMQVFSRWRQMGRHVSSGDHTEADITDGAGRAGSRSLPAGRPWQGNS